MLEYNLVDKAKKKTETKRIKLQHFIHTMTHCNDTNFSQTQYSFYNVSLQKRNFCM